MGVQPPCSSWATVVDVLSGRCPDADNGCGDLDAYVLQQALDDASFLLNAWTAFQYQGGQDGCEATIRPTPSFGPRRSAPEWVPPAGGWSWGMWPTNYGGSYWGPTSGMLDQNMVCCYGSTRPLGRSGDCGCGGASQVGLDAYPILSVEEVLVNGQVVDPDLYRVDDQRWLVRVRGEDEGDNPHWPNCQHLNRPATEEGTWEVTYLYGALVPEAGVQAAIALGCAIARERCGGDCLLPINTSSVAKQGVTVQLVRPTEQIIDSLPSAVRTFLNAVNVHGIRQRPRIVSPDLPREGVTQTYP